MNYRIIYYFIFLSLFNSVIFGQNYHAPLDFKMLLSGTFGELRSNHFHSGIDIKTEGVEGQKVYAIEDGFVSRIKVSTGGYGKAIYITHPDGNTSVYAHLKNFNKDINNYVIKNQYKNIFSKPVAKPGELNEMEKQQATAEEPEVVKLFDDEE